MFKKSMCAVAGGAAALMLAGAAIASGPVNGSCGGALPVGLGSINANNCDAYMSVEDCDYVGADKVLWYSFTAPDSNKFVIDTFGSGFDTVLLAYDDCGGPLLACNDDTSGLQSRVSLSLAAGQTVKIAVGKYYSAESLGEGCGSFRLNIAVGQEDCCQPWDNGRYDGLNAQTSQIGYDRDWSRFARVTADDFWLCEGNVYRIRTVRAVMSTDAIVPKAQVVLLSDCDGTPSYPVALADSQSIAAPDVPFGLFNDCVFGTVEIHDIGPTNDEGFRQVEVVASFPKLWLKGGAYWLAVAGYSGTADPEEQFFWGTSGYNVVKGRPGKFYNSDDQSWTDIDLLCCGCTDFNFCIQGEQCKILLDNGVPDFLFTVGGPGLASLGPAPMVPGSPSLQNGTRTSDKSRTADDFVVPPCSDLTLCYLEGYVLTNCTRVRLDIFDGACHCPSEAEPLVTLEPQCLSLIRRPVVAGEPSAGLNLYKAEFFDFKGIKLIPGHNYWVSLYALGDNSQNARGYFLWNYKCGTMCQVNFEPGCVKGPAYGNSHWTKAVPEHDFAFLVAVSEPEREAVVAPPEPTCAADFNHRDGVTVQDLFDFLSVWFAGCP